MILEVYVYFLHVHLCDRGVKNARDLFIDCQGTGVGVDVFFLFGACTHFCVLGSLSCACNKFCQKKKRSPDDACLEAINFFHFGCIGEETSL